MRWGIVRVPIFDFGFRRATSGERGTEPKETEIEYGDPACNVLHQIVSFTSNAAS